MKKTTFILLNSVALLAGTTLAHAATLVADYNFDTDFSNSVQGSSIGELTKIGTGTMSVSDGSAKVGTSYYTAYGVDLSSLGSTWAMSLDVSLKDYKYHSSIMDFNGNLTLALEKYCGGLGIAQTAGYSAESGYNNKSSYYSQTISKDWQTISIISMGDGTLNVYLGTDKIITYSPTDFTGGSADDLKLGTVVLGSSKYPTSSSKNYQWGVVSGTLFDNLKFYSVDSGDTLSSVERTVVGIVPEPSAFGLLAGAGVLALAVARRRRPCRKS